MSAREEAKAAKAEYIDALTFGRPVDAHRLAMALDGLLAEPEATWEYGASIDGGNPEPVWDEYPGDEGRANLEEGGAAKLVRRRKAGPWEDFEGV